MNRCVIVGAAPVADPAYLKQLLHPDDFLVAADGGQDTMHAMGCAPALLVADFDSSCSAAPLSDATEVVQLPACKDDTDTLAAVKLARQRGYREFLLLGCLGGRLDHTIANLQVLASLTADGCSAVLADEHNEVRLWEPGEHQLPYRADSGFSLLAFDPVVVGITIRQAVYTLENGTLTSNFPLGISNEFVPELPALVSFTSGRLLVVCSKD